MTTRKLKHYNAILTKSLLMLQKLKIKILILEFDEFRLSLNKKINKNWLKLDTKKNSESIDRVNEFLEIPIVAYYNSNPSTIRESRIRKI